MSDQPSRLKRALSGLMVATGALVLTAACGSTEEAEPNVVTLTATDFAFAVAGTFVAGTNEITLTNNGQQPHHGQLIQLSDGKTVADLGAAMAEGGEQLPEWARFVGGPGAVDPGQSTTLSASIEAGSYALLCFIPDFSDGVPHVAKGMMTAFDVAAEPKNAAEAPAATVKISGGDYLFDAPAQAKAGKTTIAFTNGGGETHEIAIVKLSEGATVADFLDVLTAVMGMSDGPPPSGPPPGMFVGGVQGILSGVTQSAIIDLAQGDYGLLCFFSNKDGVPHFALGMAGQIHVE